MYYVYKTGIYGHGVFWIGEDLKEGKMKADILASSDKDGYHSWELHQYDANSACEEHEPIYVGTRTVQQEP